jgi:hypothetical protein
VVRGKAVNNADPAAAIARVVEIVLVEIVPAAIARAEIVNRAKRKVLRSTNASCTLAASPKS